MISSNIRSANLFLYITNALSRLNFCVYPNSESKKAVLPSASSILLNGNNNSGQVFNNPYKRAEIDQIASLEKHVKMVRNILFAMKMI